MDKKLSIGGQAILEGVMMRGKKSMAVAVRDTDGVIRIKSQRIANTDSIWRKIPVIRGIVNFFYSIVVGISTVNMSAEVFMREENQEQQQDAGKDNSGWLLAIAVVLSLGMSIGLFILLPSFITGLIGKLFNWDLSPLVNNLIEGAIKMTIFVSYISVIALIKDIKRMYRYHGAEHKTINAYESGLELTVQNIQKCSTVNDRCGTTFMFFVMFISILLFSLTGWQENVFIRLAIRLALLPLVAGLSYEVLKLLAKTKSKFFLIFKAPGLLLQKISTAQPDDSMVEVALAAFNTVMIMEKDDTVAEVDFFEERIINLKQLYKKVCDLLVDGGVTEGAETDWIICHVTGLQRSQIVSNFNKNITIAQQRQIDEIVNKRLTGMPLQQIFGKAAFYGCEFIVNQHTLIPRAETELLAEQCIKRVTSSSSVLDLCTGSGCIAITVANKTNCKVLGSDISQLCIETATQNARQLNAAVDFVVSDMFDSITGKFDVIVSNPPYIKTADIQKLDKNVKDYEPIGALDGGGDGLDFYRIIAARAKEFLNDDGLVLLEVGENQAASVCGLLKDFDTGIIKDYEGIDRIIIAKLKANIAEVQQ